MQGWDVEFQRAPQRNVLASWGRRGVALGRRRDKRQSAAGTLVLCCFVCACNDAATNDTATRAAEALPTVDQAAWRTVSADEKHSFDIWSDCAVAEDDLARSDPSLKDPQVDLQTLDAQVSRRGKLQVQCAWEAANGRAGRLVVDVRCWNTDNDRCSQFAYGLEAGRRIEPVPAPPEQPPPPISTAFPPGRDDLERNRSKVILSWARDNAPEELGALRADIRGVTVGIEATAKLPILCGEVRAGGGGWRRFAVFGTGGADFHWLAAPKDARDLGDFCDVRKATLQWYAVPDSAMN